MAETMATHMAYDAASLKEQGRLGAVFQSGIHVLERRRLGGLSREGVDVPEPWMGVLDVLRMVEGHRPEPPERQPLGVHGLDALVAAVPDEALGVLQALRSGFVEARRYFTWKEIPVVLLVDGAVDDPSDGTGLYLAAGERRIPLAPFLGTRFQPARPKVAGWWWAPQIG
jgi:hypothetical protein